MTHENMRQGFHVVTFLGENLRPTEPQFADPYVLLTAHTLYDIWVETGDQHHMWRALMILEKSLVKSPANFQAKLLLIKLYCIMGEPLFAN